MHKNTANKIIIACTNIIVSSNCSNAKKAHTNKTITVDESNVRRMHANIMAITNAIMIAKKKAKKKTNANIAATVNTIVMVKRKADVNIVATASKKI